MANLKNKQQFGRFALVGLANTALDFGLLFILHGLGLPVLLANIASSTTAFIASFVANKKYTFRSHGDSLLREMVLFVVVTLFGLWVLQSVVIWLVLPLMKALLADSLALLAAKLVATVVSMSWNYILYATVVFRGKPAGKSRLQ